MRRLAAAFFVPLVITGALAGCSSGAPATENSSVSVSGPEGRSPTVTIPSAAASTDLVTKTLIQGNGPVITSADAYLANLNLYLWQGKTHKLLYSTYGKTLPVLSGQIGLSGLTKAVTGQHVGSRVLAVLPPKYGYGAQGNPNIGVGATDTTVWVLDLLQAFPSNASASGKAVGTGGGDLPTVTGPASKPPVITIPSAKTPPATTTSATLIKGTGAPVKVGQTVVVRYTGEIWRTGKVFDTNWPSATSANPLPTPFTLSKTTIIPGWVTGLAGVPVGSRVLMVIPPADGYGKTGNSSAGITGTDTLVFVVDIIAAR